MVVTATAATVLLVSGCSTGDVDKKDKPDSLPAVILESFDSGPALDLGTLRGPAVVNLWASWCGPCRKELPHYEAYAKKYAGRVQVIGIDFQDTQKDRARALIERTGVDYPLYSDPDGHLRAVGLPKVILVDAQGRVTYEKYAAITSLTQLEKLARTHLDVR